MIDESNVMCKLLGDRRLSSEVVRLYKYQSLDGERRLAEGEGGEGVIKRLSGAGKDFCILLHILQ